jgi:hypothetical protein
MSKLIDKYAGKRLSTDEVAEARMAIEAEVKELENIKYETGEDYLLLKWGTLKSWDFHTDRAKELLKEYSGLGSSASAMLQKDTDRQKQIICELIDECDGVIQNDWDGNYYTKQQAKEYVMGYSS